GPNGGVGRWRSKTQARPPPQPKDGFKQGDYLKKQAQSSESGGRRYATALPSTRQRSRNVPSVPNKRKRKPMHHTVTLWTYNGSGWGTIKEIIAEEMQGLQCYAVQEHHLTTEKLAVVTQSMKAQGRQLGGAAAVATTGPSGEAGTSARVAIAVPKRVGMPYLDGKDGWEISPRSSPGGAAAARLAVGKGVVLATVYLWTAEGMTYQYTQLITHMIGKLQNVMAQAESVKAARTTAVTANAVCGTCRHAYGCSEIDYFLVADAVVAQIQHVAVQETWPAAPHTSGGLTIKLKAVERMIRVLEKPKALPEVQVGCAPEPPRYEEVKQFRTQDEANQEWAKYMLALEKEAFQMRGMHWDHSDPRAGRAEEPKWRVKAFNFGGGNVPTAARAATWWRWITGSMHGMQGAHQRWRLAKDCEQIQKRGRVVAELERLFRMRPRRKKHIGAKDQGARQARCDMIATGQLREVSRKEILQCWTQEAECRMKEVDQQLPEDRKAEWADKLEVAAAGAAGGLHKLSKAAVVWRPR
ncbi:unnamed protein product, partial [Prorocentrum cordatum]